MERLHRTSGARSGSRPRCSAVSALVSGSTTTSASTSLRELGDRLGAGRVAERVPAEHDDIARCAVVWNAPPPNPRVASTATRDRAEHQQQQGDRARRSVASRGDASAISVNSDDERRRRPARPARAARPAARSTGVRSSPSSCGQHREHAARRRARAARRRRGSGGTLVPEPTSRPAARAAPSLDWPDARHRSAHAQQRVGRHRDARPNWSQAAVAAGLDVVAITDHDSTAGWTSAFVAAEGTGTHRRARPRAQHPARLRERARARLPRRSGRTRR